ncbi:c-type cytochrome [Pelomicrobium sp.]|jgi:mono/diheme cytochrome c family protein|uniref:c-type cytochrome n=1 Tax=Pelomicrobium sp. TaxID=2815319 RepID=UPI002FDD5BB5
MRSRNLIVALAAALAVTSCATVEQMKASMTEAKPAKPPVAYGKPISEADIAPWNIDIRTPDGKGLPPGSGTVAQGKQVYEAKCAACHGPDAKGGPQFGTMVGGINSFTTNQRVLTPGSMYPYAPILFDYIRRAMPMDRPQTLTSDEVYAVSAYILYLNGLIPDNFVMNAQTMPTIQMPNRNGFILDDRPDVHNERCMRDCKPIRG